MEGFEENIIAHFDMDAFFASVEEQDKPWLSGLPIVVGSDPLGGEGRGVVSTASYKAREYGIHSALPIKKAWQLSEAARKRGEPQVAFLTPNFRRYSEVSNAIFDIVGKYSSKVLKVGSDEGYFDLSYAKSFSRAEHIARRIKKEVKQKTKLTASIGIGSNRLVAKIASDFQKPDGLTLVPDEEVLDFLAPLSVRKIPGVGPKAEVLLKKKGVRTVADLQKLPYEELEKVLGSWGFSLFHKARGVGSASLQERGEAKSIGEHHTFDVDVTDRKVVFSQLERQAKSIIRTLEKQKFKSFRTVVLTVRFSDFETKTKSLTLKEERHTAEELNLKAMKLALPYFEKTGNPKKKAIRLIGLRVEKLL